MAKPKQVENNTEVEKTETEVERPRNFFLNTYIAPLALHDFLVNAKWVKHFAFITHDQDTYTATSKEVLEGKRQVGDPKEPHTHILLRTYNGKTLTSVVRLFNLFSRSYYERKGETPQNTFGEIARDVVDCFDYLTHKNDPLKHPYTKDLIVTDNPQYWSDLVKATDDEETADNKAYSMFCDVLGGMSTTDLLKRYGMSYLMQNRNVDRLVEKCARESGQSTYSAEELFGLMFKSTDCPFGDNEITLFWIMFDWLSKTQKIKTSAEIEIYLNYGDNK